jgi:hypothetical protein
MKKIPVKDATLKIPSGFLGIIDKWIPGALKLSRIPIPIIIVDIDSQQEFPGELISALPFSGCVPEIIALQVMNQYPSQCHDDLLQIHGVSDINHLAYYLYGNFSHNSDSTLLEKVPS